MRSSQVTIKDIAERLGISPSTVSRALNNHPEISEETRQTVQKTAEEMNYEPNALALGLRSSRSNIIGLIIPEIIHFFFSQVISGIEDIAYDAGFHVMVCQSNESYIREVKNVQAMLSSRVEGLLVCVSKETRDFSHFRNLVGKHIPMVFFDRVCQEIETDRVINDDDMGAYYAVKHLISRGCKRIAHLSTAPELQIGRKRYDGYVKALTEHNLPVDERLVVRCDTHQSARLVTKRLVYETNPPDGIFAVNDLTAIGALQTIKECGLQVPDDIAIVGFGNGNYSQMTDPPLTTVEQFGYEMGEKAMQMLLDRIIGRDDFPARTEQVNTELIIRESTVKKRTFSI